MRWNKNFLKEMQFLLLLIVFSPSLIVMFCITTLIGVLYLPIEFIIYQKNYRFLDKYSPLITLGKMKELKTYQYLKRKNSFLRSNHLKNGCDVIYDRENNVYCFQNLVIYFSENDFQKVKQRYGTCDVEFIIITRISDIRF